MNHIKTFMLLAAMTALFVGVGYLIGGATGMLIALAFALVMTVTATIAGAIAALANFALFFGGRDRPGGIIGTLAIMLLAPMAAALVQMAISRTREYGADRVGAEIAGDPQALASALAKMERYARGEVNVSAERNPATAHMFIINPLNGKGADNLFSTHPATANRIKALNEMGGGSRPAFFAEPEAPRGGAFVPVTETRRGPWG